METTDRLDAEQAELLAKALIDREPRVRDSWLGTWARGWAARSRTGEVSGHEFNPLTHPSNSRWSTYNSIFDSWKK